MKQNEFFCVLCKKVVSLDKDDICLTYFKNQVPALVGHCRKCDITLTKFVKHVDAKNLERKYGKCGYRS